MIIFHLFRPCLFLFSLFLLFLCWGSFLNAFAYRILRNKSLLTRSACPHCSRTISWYDLIPVLSFFILSGKCRACNKKISWLYPIIELSTAFIFLLITIKIPPHYWLAYFVLASALIINTRTDLEEMVIPRITSLFLIPIGLLSAACSLLPITFTQSIVGAFFGYGILWITAFVFKKVTGKDGLGEGDFELLALIGSFTGIAGVLHALFIGSLIGSIIGITLIITKKYSRNSKLPFGPLLAIGTIFYLCFPHLLKLL